MRRSSSRVAKTVLSDAFVQDVHRQALDGSFEGCIKEWWDADFIRLVLRGRGRAVRFYYRRRDATIGLGDADVVSLKEARFRAVFVHEVLEQGGSVREAKEAVRVIEAKKRLHADADIAHHEAAKVMLKDHGGGPNRAWTWREMSAAYLVESLPKLAERWGKQVAALLGDERFELIADRPLNGLEFDDVDNVIKQIVAARGAGPAKRIVEIVKKMMNWAAAAQRTKRSGLDKVNKWWLDLSVEHKTSIRDHTPLIKELVTTIIIVERMTERKKSPVAQGTLGMLWAAVLLAQRAGQFQYMTRKRLLAPDAHDEFAHDYAFDDEEDEKPVEETLGPGWKIFTWSPQEMKKSRGHPLPHVLPIPPEALAVLLQFGTGSKFLFPSGKADGPCTQSALNQLFRRLAGARNTSRSSKSKTDEKGLRSGGFDFFAANKIRQWTPHDVRNTITGFLNFHKMGGASSAILSHRERRDGEKAERERMLSVTKLHYHHDQQIFLKADGMNKWTKAVLKKYHELKVEASVIVDFP
ncbi:MAG: hypothetical protein PGN33_18715 [Methylobacterium radiotolerans]